MVNRAVVIVKFRSTAWANGVVTRWPSKFVVSANRAGVHVSVPQSLAFPPEVIDIRGPSVYGGVGLGVLPGHQDQPIRVK